MLGYRGAVVMNQQPLPRVQGDTRVGDYRLLAKIGEGGMGVVHLAQRPDGARVALKVLRPHIIGDDEARTRLAREVASLRRVTSPRIAEVIDADPWGETPYVATRYVPGLSLHELKLAKGGGKGRLFLLRIAAGSAVPQHGHGGEELTLILRGSYSDRFGRFAVGDVAALHRNVVHRPVVDKNDNCVCLIATEAPARFTSLIMRMIQPLVRI